MSIDKTVSASHVKPFKSDKDFGGQSFPFGISVAIAVAFISSVTRLHLHKDCSPEGQL